MSFNDDPPGPLQACHYPQQAIAESGSHLVIEENIKYPSNCTFVNNLESVVSNNPGISTEEPVNTSLTEDCNITPSNLSGMSPSTDALISEQIQVDNLPQITYTITTFDDNNFDGIANADDLHEKSFTVLHSGNKFSPVKEMCTPANNNNVFDSPRNSQENNSDDGLFPIIREISSLSNLPTPENIIPKTSARSARKMPKAPYCDFLDNENEFEIEYSSSSWEGSSEEDNEHLLRNKNKKKKGK